MNDKIPFVMTSMDGYLSLSLNGHCNASSFLEFEKQFNLKLIQPVPHVAINCEHLISISKDWLRFLLKVQVQLKSSDKQMLLLLVQPDLMKNFKKEGLDAALKFSPNLRDALLSFGIETKKTFNTDFINPFLNATLHVLKVQANVLAEPQKIYLKKNGDSLTGDISGLIGIVSDSFNGSVVISFPEQTFLKIMSGMLGETFTVISRDILDGAGELTNMIFGQAKTVLNEKGYGIKIAIPSVISGKNHSLSAMTNGPIVVIPFDSAAGKFFVEICLSI
jgi:chemotaxis protein CheX